ncbi:hypothetical protein GQ42DRAFT_62425 [Ramicandelaber brevisporus]|nr:hypothetical protein GQ42DRAFT_62425 [Ramicandelaber brevisporus]
MEDIRSETSRTRVAKREQRTRQPESRSWSLFETLAKETHQDYQNRRRDRRDSWNTSGLISPPYLPIMSYSFGFGNGVYIADFSRDRSRKYTYSGAKATEDYWSHGYTG